MTVQPKKQPRPKVKAWQCVIAGLVLAALFISALGAIFGPKGDPEARLKAELERSSGVERVTRDGQTLRVRAAVNSLDGGQYVVDSLGIAKAFGLKLRAVKASGTAPVNTVVLTISGPAIDRLGNQTTEPFLRLTYPAADLRSAQFDNLTYGRQADLADHVEVVNGAGMAAVHSFCANPNLGGSAVLCR